MNSVTPSIPQSSQLSEAALPHSLITITAAKSIDYFLRAPPLADSVQGKLMSQLMLASSPLSLAVINLVLQMGKLRLRNLSIMPKARQLVVKRQI